MSKNIPKALMVGKLKLSSREISCAVLDDEKATRVLVERSMAEAIGQKGSGSHWAEKKQKKSAVLPEYVSAKFLRPFISKELEEKLKNPIKYTNLQGLIVNGVPATVLPDICDIWIQAKEKGALTEKQKVIANTAYLLMRGFATGGIIALVDEATGYQYVRARNALEKILDEFIAIELRKWAKTFPDEFYKEMFRLRGWNYIPFSVKRPSVVGKYTNDLIYERLAPEVLNELRKKNPVDKKGRRKHKHFQWLTEDVGDPRLREHLNAIIALMRASTNWKSFYRLVQRAFPKYNEHIQLMALRIDDFDEKEATEQK